MEVYEIICRNTRRGWTTRSFCCMHLRYARWDISSYIHLSTKFCLFFSSHLSQTNSNWLFWCIFYNALGLLAPHNPKKKVAIYSCSQKLEKLLSILIQDAETGLSADWGRIYSLFSLRRPEIKYCRSFYTHSGNLFMTFYDVFRNFRNLTFRYKNTITTCVCSNNLL